MLNCVMDLGRYSRVVILYTLGKTFQDLTVKGSLWTCESNAIEDVSGIFKGVINVFSRFTGKLGESEDKSRSKYPGSE